LEFDLYLRSLSTSLFGVVFAVLDGIATIFLELGSEVVEFTCTVGTLLHLREALGVFTAAFNRVILGAKGAAAGLGLACFVMHLGLNQ